MPRTTRRLGLFAALLVPAAAFVPAHAQVPVPVRPALPPPPGGVALATPAAPAVRTDNGRFTLPEQRDAKGQLQAILDYLGRTTVPWDVVTGTAQRLLDAPSDSFYRVKDAKGDDTGTVVSVKSKVNQILAGLPKDGRQFYEQEFGSTAAALLKTAVDAGGDRTALETVSHRYFHTKAGAQATLLLANADLSGGRTAQAAYGYARLLDRPQEADPLPTRVLFRAAVAFKRAGGAKEAALAADLLDRAVKGSPRDGLVVGRQALNPDELRAEFDRAVQAVAVADRYATGRYGNDARNGVGDAGTPFLDPAFVSPLVNAGQTGDGSDTVRQMVADGIKKAEVSRKEVVIPGFFPVTTSELVIFRTYDGLCAVAAKAGPGRPAGSLVWRNGAGPYGGGVGAQTLYGRTEARSPEEYWGFWSQNAPRILFENAALGAVSHDGVRAYYLDDLAVPPPPQVQNPNMGFQPQGTPPARDDAVSRRAGYNRLVAVDIATGKTAWWLGGPEGKPLTEAEEAAATSSLALTEGSYFLGPPLTVDGKVYALYEKRGRVRLGCFDPDKMAVGPAGVEEPAHVWSQVLGDATASVRTEPYRRMQAAFLAHADGVMVCPTNCGAVVAVDVNARSLLWARYYGTPPDPKQVADNQPGMPPGVIIRGGRPVGRNGVPIAAAVSAERWRAAAPIITAGKVLVAAHDSDLLQCLDVRTGEPVWDTPREPDDLYVGGVLGGNVLVVSKTSVRAYAVSGDGKGGRKPAWAPVAVGTPAGHGAAGKDGLYYLPTTGAPDQTNKPAPQVWAVDAATGRVKAKTAYRRKLDPATDPRVALGNLVFHDGLLFSQTPLELSAFPLLEPKRREMAERLKANPRDPDGLVTRGELSLEAGAVREAVADFKAAQKELADIKAREKIDPLGDINRRLDHKLYSAYAELARVDFAAVEPDLPEYKKLCDLHAESDDPGETRRLLDEQFQRHSLFLQLLARGREGQGRAGEAFDAYRAFARHGDGKQLVTIDGEPNGQTRPDVWARGRLEALVRTAADPAARTDLAARVDKEWAALKDSTDLAKLRAFADLYGAHFAAGRAAGLALADALAATGTADDAQEARDVLARLAATAEDPADAARAIERHAALLKKRGAVEDAVVLYAQLGSTYATVVVRDGKTGGDVFAEVIADRRLLQYLDPGAAGPSAAYKVEVVGSQQARSVTQAFTLSPTGDLAPAYRRLHLSLEQTPDESWALKATDRVTGEVRARFPNLGGDGRARAGQGGQTGPAAARLAVANGHRILLTLDHTVYCLDLAAPRKVWELNLLGKSMLAPEGQPELTDDGGLKFMYAGGWSFTLGRAAVLRPTYACLLTRDGLKCLDPATGRDLWVRTNVSPQAQVFGDDRYVFLVDKNSTRVLRAVDGTPVEKVPDFALQYNNTTAKVGLVGRGILMASPGEPKTIRLVDPLTGADVWKKQYPAGAGAVLLKTLDPKLTGVVKADGSFELLNAADGTVVAAGRVDADWAARYHAQTGATQPVALVDAERVYLVLARAEPKVPGGRRFMSDGAPFLRALSVDGPIFAFDKATGKRLWYNAEVLADQRLILERFDDLPVLVGFANVASPNGQGQAKLVVLDKRTGYLRHNFQYPQGGDFQAVSTDPRTRAVEFQRYDLTVKIAPADAPAP